MLNSDIIFFLISSERETRKIRRVDAFADIHFRLMFRSNAGHFFGARVLGWFVLVGGTQACLRQAGAEYLPLSQLSGTPRALVLGGSPRFTISKIIWRYFIAEIKCRANTRGAPLSKLLAFLTKTNKFFTLRSGQYSNVNSVWQATNIDVVNGLGIFLRMLPSHNSFPSVIEYFHPYYLIPTIVKQQGLLHRIRIKYFR